MTDKTRTQIDLQTADGETVNELLRTASREVLLEHKRAGQSVVVWDRENDQILTIPPEQIPLGVDESVESGPQELAQRQPKPRKATLLNET